ncbi:MULTISPECIES: hypothetical protein [unclassified Microbispora]|nr:MULTISPECIES: hypothetical protein [unclassified Microbispora]NJP24877.1 hypothetical protein [Microbispora sp. CL1-1]
MNDIQHHDPARGVSGTGRAVRGRDHRAGGLRDLPGATAEPEGEEVQ